MLAAGVVDARPKPPAKTELLFHENIWPGKPSDVDRFAEFTILREVVPVPLVMVT